MQPTPLRPAQASSLLTCCLLLACATSPRPAAITATPTATRTATGTITGSVRDAASTRAVSFVDVAAMGADGRRVGDTTRSDGSFRLAELAPGTYHVTATYSGHSVSYDNVAVSAGAIVELAIAIDAEAGEVTIDYAATGGDAPRPGATSAAPPDRGRTRHTTGSIRGVVRDSTTHEELPGAVVAATAPGLRDARMAIADDAGGYLLPSLPPGTYTLSVYYHLIERGNIEIRRSNITIAPGEIKVVDLDLDAETDP